MDTQTERALLPIRRCLQCGSVIIPGGRADRKFCCQECKNRFWNRRRHPEQKNLVSRIIRILDRNYAILQNLMAMGISSLDRVTLLQLGFNLNYSTSYHKMGTRNVYTCYDIIYEMTPSRVWRIAHLSGEGADSDEAEKGLYADFTFF